MGGGILYHDFLESPLRKDLNSLYHIILMCINYDKSFIAANTNHDKEYFVFILNAN